MPKTPEAIRERIRRVTNVLTERHPYGPRTAVPNWTLIRNLLAKSWLASEDEAWGSVPVEARILVTWEGRVLEFFRGHADSPDPFCQAALELIAASKLMPKQ
jgi:hypothetical protein